MHAADVIAYAFDGAIECPDCADPDATTAHGDCAYPVFGDDEAQLAGATCHACRCFYVPGDGWTPPEDASAVRWSRCTACNAQRPYASADYRYARRDAWRGRLACGCCGKRGTVRFLGGGA
jgi:hypothetical protein